MADWSLVTEDHVEDAIAEYDLLGPERFHADHGIAASDDYVLVHRSRAYDAQAVLGVAHELATGRPATSEELSGRRGAPSVLRAMDYRVAAIGVEETGVSWSDAEDLGPQHSTEAWAAAARLVLLDVARRYHATTTYAELAAAVQRMTRVRSRTPVHLWLPDVLYRVTDECAAHLEPSLASLCLAPGADDDERAATERLEVNRYFGASLPADGGRPALARPEPSKPRAARTPRSSTPRATATRAPKPAEKPVDLCPTCFTALPATKVCDYCD